MSRFIRTLSRVALATTLAALAACTSAPRYRSTPEESKSSEIAGREVVAEARKFIGTPYRMGGTSKAGIDCSGLVVTVFESFGIAVPRTSHEQATFGKKVSRAELEPGDLVFFCTSGTTRISHVGIYSGGGEFIHASTRSRRVQYDRLDNRYFRKRFATARRIL
jgi:cell wall-associated NlpC family hydrolase